MNKFLYPLLTVLLISITWMIACPPAATQNTLFSYSNESTKSLKQELYKELNETEILKIVVDVPEQERLQDESKSTSDEQPNSIGVFGYIDKQNNVFNRPILAGYYLSNEINAETAANLLNNYVIEPGEVFSFNDTVGERRVDRGFTEGRMIVGDQYVPVIGGGVCKTSTALLQAAQQAGLKIIEAHQHTMPVSYASRGQDSAVAWKTLDLQFQNTLDYPLQIIVAYDKGLMYLGITEELAELERSEGYT